MWTHSFFFIAFPAIFTVVNPLAVVGPFLAMTAGDTLDKKNSTARRACLVAMSVLLICAAAGTFLFEFFGITLPALKIAGGCLLFSVAIDMVNARESRAKTTAEERAEGVQKDDIAIFPLGIPLLGGPGAMISVFILEQRASGTAEHGAIYLAIIITMVLCYFVLKQAKHLARVLGATGINVMGRIMGLILAAIAVQFILTGAAEALPGLVHR